jgi:Ran GTPase-activating protein (RanGAP) involved in mRNA processing and transport
MNVKIISNDTNLSSSTNGFNRSSNVWDSKFALELNNYLVSNKGLKIVLPISEEVTKDNIGSFKENYTGKSKNLNKTIWCYLTSLLSKKGFKKTTNLINFGLNNDIPSISILLEDGQI